MERTDPYMTPEWQTVREFVWRRDRGLCYLCKAPGLDCHHLRYDDFHDPEWVILVCRRCHDVWQGRPPLHLPDTNPFKPKLERIAEIKRCLKGLVWHNGELVPSP